MTWLHSPGSVHVSALLCHCLIWDFCAPSTFIFIVSSVKCICIFKLFFLCFFYEAGYKNLTIFVMHSFLTCYLLHAYLRQTGFVSAVKDQQLTVQHYAYDCSPFVFFVSMNPQCQPLHIVNKHTMEGTCLWDWRAYCQGNQWEKSVCTRSVWLLFDMLHIYICMPEPQPILYRV